jgi:hypothetical protein
VAAVLAAGALAGPGTISRVHDVGAVRDYLAVAAVLAGRADLPTDARLAEGLRGEHRDANLWWLGRPWPLQPPHIG